MPSSSGNYSFQQVSAQVLIKEAFERIGLVPDQLTSQQFEGAIRSINLLLTDWSNRNLNFWTIEQGFIGLTPGIKQYSLPIQTLKVIQCELRTSTTQAYVTLPLPNPYQVASSPAGTSFALDFLFDMPDPIPTFVNQPANCFTGSPSNTAYCQQVAPNGNIGWNFGLINGQVVTTNNQQINFIGIVPNVNATYNLNIEASNDDVVWSLLYNTGAIIYTVDPNSGVGVTKWFEIPNNINVYQYYRVREITVGNAAVPLNLQQIYFNNSILDTTMSEVSQYNYLQYPQKNLLGRPTVYYVNYQVLPMISIWQNPSPLYNCILYSIQQMIETVVNATDSIDIPSNFYDPLVWGLSYRLAQKYALDRVQVVEGVYRDSLDAAIIKNRVNLPLTFGLYGTGS